MSWHAFLPLGIVLSSLLPGLVIFGLREDQQRLRVTLNLLGVTLKLVLVGSMLYGVSQGSEYRAVVVVLLPTHYVMLQRNLLYTAVTRAQELVVIVGNKRALAIAVGNDKIAARHSGLAERLRPGGAW